VRLDDYSNGGSQIAVEAPGYLPAASPVYLKAGLFTNDFQLKKGRGISGTVQWADGTPVTNATVVLVERSDSVSIDRPGELRRSSSGAEFQRSNLKGRFEFLPKLEPHTILAAHPQGFAEVRVSDVSASGKVILQPWGRLKGVLRVGQKPEPGQSILVENAFFRSAEVGRSYPALSTYLRTEPDAQGNFVFDQVPPGERRVCLQYKLNDREFGRTATSHGVPVTVSPGETKEVILGGDGRRVVGRIVALGAEPEDIDWRRDVHMLQSQVVLPAELSAPWDTPKMTDEERRKAWQIYREKQAAFWRSEEGRRIERNQRSYVLLFDSDGSFHIDNVPPGDYTLYVSVTNPERGDNYYETVGSLNKPVTIPAASAGGPNQSFDVGQIQLPIRGMLRVGRKAPKFEVKTFDDKPVKLEDFKGRYVLLDFWATAPGTRPRDVTILKSLHDTYGKDNRLAMIGLNFDSDPKHARTLVEQSGLKWTQCYAGPLNDTSLCASYGIQELPEAVLIDPEGKIAAKNLRGSNLRNTVRNLLTDRGSPRAKR
jgi:peroxiredoxin